MMSRLRLPLRLGLTRLDATLMRRLLSTVAFALALFTLLWLAPDILFELVQALLRGDVTLWQMGQLLLLNLPNVLQQSLPIAAAVAGVFLTRQLSQSFEWIAFQTAGIARWRIALPMVLVGGLLTLGYVVVQEAVLPWSAPLLKQQRLAAGLAAPTHQDFVYLERLPAPAVGLSKFLLVGDATRLDDLRDITLFYYQPLTPTTATTTQAIPTLQQIHRLFRAKSATWDDAQQNWLLRNGTDYELDKDGVYRQVSAFKQQRVSTASYPIELLRYQAKGDPATRGFVALATYVGLLNASGQTQDAPYYKVRLVQKLTLPLACLLLLPLGAALGLQPARSNKAGGLTATAALLFVYLVSVPFATNFGSMGLLPAWVAACLPLGLVLVIGALLIVLKRRFAF